VNCYKKENNKLSSSPVLVSAWMDGRNSYFVWQFSGTQQSRKVKRKEETKYFFVADMANSL
jgi:hypothetical protein